MQQPHARAPRNAVQSPAAVGTFSSTSLPRSGSSSSSSSSASSYNSDHPAEHSQFESDATATNRPTCTDHNVLIQAVMKEVKSVIKVSTDNIEKKFTTIESKLGTIEAAVKELSSIVKSTSTHGFSIKGSAYEVHT